MQVIHGQIENLDRTSEVSGGHNTQARTTHVCMFTLNGVRIHFKSSGIPPISNGDIVKVAGQDKNGFILALACKNESTGWIGNSRRNGCVLFLLIPMILFSLLFGPFALIITPLLLLLLILAILSDLKITKAKSLIKN